MEEKFAGGNRVGKGLAPSRCATGTAPAPYFRLLINRMSESICGSVSTPAQGAMTVSLRSKPGTIFAARLEDRFAEVGFVGDHGTDAVAEGTQPAAQKKNAPRPVRARRAFRRETAAYRRPLMPKKNCGVSFWIAPGRPL